MIRGVAQLVERLVREQVVKMSHSEPQVAWS